MWISPHPAYAVKRSFFRIVAIILLFTVAVDNQEIRKKELCFVQGLNSGAGCSEFLHANGDLFLRCRFRDPDGEAILVLKVRYNLEESKN